jgi:hypothetical protein
MSDLFYLLVTDLRAVETTFNISLASFIKPFISLGFTILESIKISIQKTLSSASSTTMESLE